MSDDEKGDARMKGEEPRVKITIEFTVQLRHSGEAFLDLGKIEYVDEVKFISIKEV